MKKTSNIICIALACCFSLCFIADAWCIDTETSFLQAKELFSRGNHQEALKGFDTILSSQEHQHDEWLNNPSNRATIHIYRGETLRNLESYQKALKEFEEILANPDQYNVWFSDPDNRVQVYFSYGVLLSALGRFPEALRSYAAAFANRNTQYNTWRNNPNNRADFYF